jgi:hypothetical protein
MTTVRYMRAIMIEEDRDDQERLKVPYFEKLIREQYPSGTGYHAGEFKNLVEASGVLRDADWDLETNGYPKWKHRADRAAQKILTGI